MIRVTMTKFVQLLILSEGEIFTEIIQIQSSKYDINGPLPFSVYLFSFHSQSNVEKLFFESTWSIHVEMSEHSMMDVIELNVALVNRPRRIDHISIIIDFDLPEIFALLSDKFHHNSFHAI
jgi:hypothetical protein